MNATETLLAAELDAMASAMPMPVPVVKYAIFFSPVGAKTFGIEPVRVGGLYTTRKRAQSSADKRDLAYGSYAHTVRMVAA